MRYPTIAGGGRSTGKLLAFAKQGLDR